MITQEIREKKQKLAFDQQGLPLPVPQQKVWFTSDNMNRSDHNDHIVV